MTEPDGPDSSIDDDRDQFVVRSNRLLIVEGDFDWGFLRALLDRHNRTGVQIGVIGGKTRYARRVLARVLTDQTDQLRRLGLARDADTDQGNPFASMIDAMRRVRESKPWFPIPSEPWQWIAGDAGRSATLFVFPPDEVPGDIEAWIWQALQTAPEAGCIEQYVSCLHDAGRALLRPWKTRVYAYVAALARPDMPLSAAGRAAELPVDSPHFRRLLDLIPADDEPLP